MVVLPVLLCFEGHDGSEKLQPTSGRMEGGTRVAGGNLTISSSSLCRSSCTVKGVCELSCEGRHWSVRGLICSDLPTGRHKPLRSMRAV
jgi:hypothetical protein